jgi:hypothetical protein
MNRRKLKQEVTRVLQDYALEQIYPCLSAYRDKDLINALFPCLCHLHELVRWHAVSVFGVVINQIAESDMEQARVIMRRFLWMLNDESGGIGWGVPEAMGEAMALNSKLAEEYSHMLVSYTLDDGPELFQDGNFLELVPLQQGVLWGLYRLATCRKELLLGHGVEQNLGYYLDSEDAQVKGLVCLLCRDLGITRFDARLESLAHDQALFRLYRDGLFMELLVADVALEAIDARKC